MIQVALPKGRLGEKAYETLAAAGYECPSILEKNRKLTFENPEKGVRYFWVKPSDVSIYVERGAADVGIAGKDILLEYRPDVYELLDLKMGKCRMCVAGPVDFYDDPNKTLRDVYKRQALYCVNIATVCICEFDMLLSEKSIALKLPEMCIRDSLYMSDTGN